MGKVSAKIAVPLAVGLLLAGLSSATMPSAAHAEGLGQEKFKVGDAAPDFTTLDLEGKEVTLSSFRGKKAVLLNFWGVRCGACLEEMPHLNVLAKKYQSSDIVFLGVDTDGLDPAMLKQIMTEMGTVADYTVLVDTEFSITDTYTNFLVPLTIVIDRDGVIRYIHTGYEKGDETKYEAAIVSALGS